jgi:hypothetical protein
MGLLSNIPNQPVAIAPVDKVLSPSEYAQSLPTLVSDPETGGMKFADNPSYSEYLNSLPNELKQTPQYTANKATDLANNLFNSFTNNGHGFGGTSTNEAQNTAQLEAIKKVDPNAYYNAMLHLDMQKAGWDAGQGKSNPNTNARIQNEIQNGLAVGIPPEQINNYVKYDYQTTAEGHAKNIAQRQGQGATLGGIEKVAPAFAAMITAGALAPAAGALEAGAAASSVAPEIAGGGFYTGGGTFAGEGLGTAAELAGPTYGELGVTGLPEGAMGPTYGEMGYTGLNQQAAIDAANAASQGSQALDTLNYANKARQILGYGNTLAKLVGGGAAATGATGTTDTTGATNANGINLAKLASALAGPSFTPMNVPQIVSKNPFLFNVPGQTQASEGMYDVSGSNLAKALRNS